MVKISKTQLEILIKLGEEGNFLHLMGYMGSFNPTAYYFFTRTMERVMYSSVQALIKKKLAHSIATTRYGDDTKVFITQAGKNYLKTIKGGE